MGVPLGKRENTNITSSKASLLNTTNKHSRCCKHCLSCLLKGIAQKRELEGVIENTKWLNNMDSAELYITRARQADAIQRMLGLKPGPWDPPNHPDKASQLRNRRKLPPIQVCIPVLHTNVKAEYQRIQMYPDALLTPEWQKSKPRTLQSIVVSENINTGNLRLLIADNNHQRKNRLLESQAMQQEYQQQMEKLRQVAQKLRKSPGLSPAQFLHFTWLNICKVAAGMKRKLTPSKQNGSQEPIQKVPSFSELNDKPCFGPSRESSIRELEISQQSKSSSGEESLEAAVTF